MALRIYTGTTRYHRAFSTYVLSFDTTLRILRCKRFDSASQLGTLCTFPLPLLSVIQ